MGQVSEASRVSAEYGRTPAEARALFREGRVTPTSGWCPGYLQANLVAVPQDWAYDFLLFGHRNPGPVPILDVVEAGSWSSPLAEGSDLRRDVPLYRIWRDGELVEEVPDAAAHWRDDLVTFLIGCSFTFEAALVRAGVPVRNIEQGTNVSMYRTAVACKQAGRLSGQLVVSMRPIPAELVSTAVRVTSRIPLAHGAPVHVGSPSALGIADIDRPDYGEAVRFEEGDVPVFWACGVTPQEVLMSSRPPFAITHAPGHMLITDRLDADYVEY